jgi:hypothetical protein
LTTIVYASGYPGNDLADGPCHPTGRRRNGTGAIELLAGQMSVAAATRMVPGARPPDAGLEATAEATARADLRRGPSIATRSATPSRSVARGLKDCRAGTSARCSPSARPTNECWPIGVDRALVRSPIACFIKADRATLGQRPAMPTGRRAGHRLPRRRAVTWWPAPFRPPSACVPEIAAPTRNRSGRPSTLPVRWNDRISLQRQEPISASFADAGGPNSTQRPESGPPRLAARAGFRS